MQLTLSYHNSTNLSGSELQHSVKCSAKQDAVIRLIFMQCSSALSPSQVLKYCEIKGYNYLITSVRRTINTLTNQGELIHTGNSIKSPYGKPEGLWIYYNKKTNII